MPTKNIQRNHFTLLGFLAVSFLGVLVWQWRQHVVVEQKRLKASLPVAYSPSLQKHILSQMDGFVEANRRCDALLVTKFLAPSYPNEDRVTIAEKIWPRQQIDIQIFNKRAIFKGNSVTTTADYSMKVKYERMSPITERGQLTLTWQICLENWCEGEWKITSCSGLRL